MFDANKVSYQALLPTVWLQLRILQEYFQPKIGRKIGIFSLGQKNNILIKKRECIVALTLELTQLKSGASATLAVTDD